ncbi:MAG: hypothetical protein B7Z80_02405 [Rhodospirillales bacterium 20-64-7]|nr:MAG: hypothetical protein B7Z80_02405 [Rhodospirillales bacterium 20-64-7]HQT76020.1 DUF423 domain-containing protein [Rhodopila sp.]
MQRVWVGLGGLAGFGAVAMAAVAAHVVAPEARGIVASAVQMEGWHALALLFTGLWSPRGGRLADAAGFAFTLGIILFCGAVYYLGLTGRSLGPVPPAGGTLLMIGWLLLGASTLRSR